MSFGQFASTSQFYLYGRSHCTRTGWENHVKAYEKPDLLESTELDLKGKVYLITGANAGIGKEITKFLAKKGAVCFMICRSPGRANAAREEIIAETGNEEVHVLLCDCSLQNDVRRAWAEFEASPHGDHLDALVCNAGALLNERTLTSEGVEVTFAAHLLYGTYLLGTLAMTKMESTPGSRMICVSSGGMYNTKFPSWEDATATGTTKYDGQFAYAYAKRGQVLLCERWTQEHPGIKFVSCHPGWTQTEAVDAAYGESKSYLEPLRTAWQGAEGIIYLCVVPSDKLVGGGFYLDRSPQVKHMAGPFFTEGSFTKNSRAEVDEMMAGLQLWCSPDRPSAAQLEAAVRLRLPLQAIQTPVDFDRYMGRWYVMANIPTALEDGVANEIEEYEWDDKRSIVNINFTYVAAGAPSTKLSNTKMHGIVQDQALKSVWKLNPKFGIYWALGLTYLVVDLPEDYSYVTVGVPDRSALWIMTKKKPLPLAAVQLAAEALGEKVAAGGSRGGSAVAGGAVETEVADIAAAPDSASAAAGSTGTGTASDSFTAEEQHAVLTQAVARAVELGHDKSKILMMPWR